MRSFVNKETIFYHFSESNWTSLIGYFDITPPLENKCGLSQEWSWLEKFHVTSILSK